MLTWFRPQAIELGNRHVKTRVVEVRLLHQDRLSVPCPHLRSWDAVMQFEPIEFMLAGTLVPRGIAHNVALLALNVKTTPCTIIIRDQFALDALRTCYDKMQRL